MALVQSNIASGLQSGTSATCAWTSNVTAGNLLVMTVKWTTSGAPVMSATDTLGNTWLNKTRVSASIGVTQQFWYCVSTGSGANTVTLTFSVSEAAIGMCVAEFSGATSTFDPSGGTNSSASASSTALSSGHVTTTNANDLCISTVSTSGAISAGAAGWTLAQFDATNNYGFAYAIVSSTGSQGYTGTTTAPWAAIVDILEMSAGGPYSFSGTGSVLETGLLTPALDATSGLSGAIDVTGVAAPSLGVNLTGVVGATGNLAVSLAPQMTGSILVTGTSTLGSLSLSGNWGITGLLKPALSPGGLTGAFGVNGTLSLILTPIKLSLLGFLGISGNLSLVYQSTASPVTVATSGIYIALTVDNSYWITYLFAGVDYSTWIKTVMSGPYVAIGRTMAYDVAVQTLYAEIGSDS
jgi:hypothetical protein